MSDRPEDRPVPPPRPRVCTSRANTHNGTNDGTNTERADGTVEGGDASRRTTPHDNRNRKR